jgi:hypothetical protein
MNYKQSVLDKDEFSSTLRALMDERDEGVYEHLTSHNAVQQARIELLDDLLVRQGTELGFLLKKIGRVRTELESTQQRALSLINYVHHLAGCEDGEQPFNKYPCTCGLIALVTPVAQE